MKIDNGTGGSRETSTGGPGSRPGRSAIDERGRESINFFAELKRRNVYKVAVAYAVVAWLMIQAASIVLQAFEAPRWAMKVLIAALAVGFPLIVALAWVFEITPGGIVRAEDVSPNESIAPRIGRKLVGVTIVLAVIAVGLLIFQMLHSRSSEQTGRRSATSLPTESPPVPEKSIAVLPFENLSDDKTNAYFATGMQDEILTRLAGIRDLKVISRSSTEQYANRPPNLKIVAEQLGVATVLEGSVQKAGATVHINVQLIDARSDSHLWAQSYDRDLKDIFGVERDVAEKVADALQAKLLPAESERMASVPTQNPEAYDLYLRANAHYQRAYDQRALSATEYPLAIELYEQALSKDPGFALAAAMLSEAHISMYWEVVDHTEARLAAAKTAAERALALQPDLGEAHEALGIYWYYGHRDYARALQQLDLARKSLPNSASVELYVGSILRRQGQWSDGITHLQRAIVLDPRSSLALDQLATAYQALRRYAEADRTYTRAVAVTRDPTEGQITLALNTVLWKGDLAPLRAALRSVTAGSDDYAGNVTWIFLLSWWSRDYPAAARAAETDRQANWAGGDNVILPRRLFLAWAYAAAGDSAKAQPLYAEVRTQVEAALQQDPDDPDLHLALGFAAAGLGLKDEAIREGRRASALMPVSRDNYSGPSYLTQLAQVYLRVGETDQAIDTLREVMAVPSSGASISPALLKLDPVWDPLRKDPRFQKLIAAAEAAQAQAETKP